MFKTLLQLFEDFTFPKEVYIIGTGASLRFFPARALADKFTIGLNQAWKSLPFKPTLNITIHPDNCIPDRFDGSIWLTKRKEKINGGMSKIWTNHIYLFENNSNVKDFTPLTGGKDNELYVGRGIHTAACHLTALAAVPTAVLVGCDFGAIDHQHHVTGQSVRFHGLPPQGVYNEYYNNLKEIRTIFKRSYGMDILSLSPYLGEDYHESEFNALTALHEVPRLAKPNDDSKYKRKDFDF